MENKHGDRRQEARKIVMAFTPVYNLQNGRLLGYLHDLTMKGAQVNGEKKLEVNATMTLSIQLPNDLPNVTATHLNIEARVARCIATPETVNSFETGFEFKEPNSEQTQIIGAILERYHFRHKMF